MSGYICSICGASAVCCKKIIVNSAVNKTYYCADCASTIADGNNVSRLGTEMFTSDGRASNNRVKKCSCGLTSIDILDSGKFGCSECYTTFRDVAENFLSIRGLGNHKGKAPIRYASYSVNSDNNDFARNVSKQGVARFNLRDNDGSAYTNSDSRDKVKVKGIDELQKEYSCAVSEERYLDADTLFKRIMAIKNNK